MVSNNKENKDHKPLMYIIQPNINKPKFSMQSHYSSREQTTIKEVSLEDMKDELEVTDPISNKISLNEQHLAQELELQSNRAKGEVKGELEVKGSTSNKMSLNEQILVQDSQLQSDQTKEEVKGEFEENDFTSNKMSIKEQELAQKSEIQNDLTKEGFKDNNEEIIIDKVKADLNVEEISNSSKNIELEGKSEILSNSQMNEGKLKQEIEIVQSKDTKVDMLKNKLNTENSLGEENFNQLIKSPPQSYGETKKQIRTKEFKDLSTRQKIEYLTSLPKSFNRIMVEIKVKNKFTIGIIQSYSPEDNIIVIMNTNNLKLYKIDLKNIEKLTIISV